MLKKMLIGGVIAVAAVIGSAGPGHAQLSVDLGFHFGSPQQFEQVPASPVQDAPPRWGPAWGTRWEDHRHGDYYRHGYADDRRPVRPSVYRNDHRDDRYADRHVSYRDDHRDDRHGGYRDDHRDDRRGGGSGGDRRPGGDHRDDRHGGYRD